MSPPEIESGSLPNWVILLKRVQWIFTADEFGCLNVPFIFLAGQCSTFNWKEGRVRSCSFFAPNFLNLPLNHGDALPFRSQNKKQETNNVALNQHFFGCLTFWKIFSRSSHCCLVQRLSPPCFVLGGGGRRHALRRHLSLAKHASVFFLVFFFLGRRRWKWRRRKQRKKENKIDFRQEKKSIPAYQSYKSDATSAVFGRFIVDYDDE